MMVPWKLFSHLHYGAFEVSQTLEAPQGNQGRAAG